MLKILLHLSMGFSIWKKIHTKFITISKYCLNHFLGEYFSVIAHYWTNPVSQYAYVIHISFRQIQCNQAFELWYPQYNHNPVHVFSQLIKRRNLPQSRQLSCFMGSHSTSTVTNAKIVNTGVKKPSFTLKVELFHSNDDTNISSRPV